MAVSRTVLPRKGLVQPQHGLTGYEADQDANWQLLDTNVAFLSDLATPQATDLGINGVVFGAGALNLRQPHAGPDERRALRAGHPLRPPLGSDPSSGAPELDELSVL